MAAFQAVGRPAGMTRAAGRKTLETDGCLCVPTQGQSVRALRVWFCLTLRIKTSNTSIFTEINGNQTASRARRLTPLL